MFTTGVVANDSYLVGRNNADSGNVNMMKVNSIDNIEIGESGVNVVILQDGSVTKTTAAPTSDSHIANKKYVDDEIEASITAATSGGLTGTLGTGTASFSKLIEYPGGLKELIGYEKEVGVATIDITSASFTGIYDCQLTAFDTQANADRACYINALTLSQITFAVGAGPTNLEGVFYRVTGY